MDSVCCLVRDETMKVEIVLPYSGCVVLRGPWLRWRCGWELMCTGRMVKDPVSFWKIWMRSECCSRRVGRVLL